MTTEKTDLEIQRELLTAYRDCELAILTGAQEYTIGSGSTARRLVRANLPDIQKAIALIEVRIANLVAPPAATRRGPVYLRPR